MKIQCVVETAVPCKLSVSFATKKHKKLKIGFADFALFVPLCGSTE